MALKGLPSDTRILTSLTIIVIFPTMAEEWFGKGDSIAVAITKKTDCTLLSNLNFETHHGGTGVSDDLTGSNVDTFKPCDDRYTDYTPCQDKKCAVHFPRDNMIYRERHCPPEEKRLRCLIPAPKGYVTPYPWPTSRNYVPFVNVPYKSLTVEKFIQNWVEYEGHVYRFPGGGTQFSQGAEAYID